MSLRHGVSQTVFPKPLGGTDSFDFFHHDKYKGQLLRCCFINSIHGVKAARQLVGQRY